VTDPLAALSERWRADADVLRHRGADMQAGVLAQCAQELEAALREAALEALTLEQAAEESGYSYSALQKKVASGELENVGERHKPRVRRGDLPRKGRCHTPTGDCPGLAERVLAGRR
jgi:hypothetical protein